MQTSLHSKVRLYNRNKNIGLGLAYFELVISTFATMCQKRSAGGKVLTRWVFLIGNVHSEYSSVIIQDVFAPDATQSFPICRRILTQQQTNFENIVVKGEIAHDEQFLLWPQCFIPYLPVKLYFTDIFQVLRGCQVFKVVFCRFVVC